MASGSAEFHGVVLVEVVIIEWDDRGRGLIREVRFDFVDDGGAVVSHRRIRWSAGEVRGLGAAYELRDEIMRGLGLEPPSR